MTSPTIVFITGVGRGIGRQLVETYLARPNTTVIGSVRDKASATGQTLSEIPTATGSKLFVLSLEVSEPKAALTAVKEIQAAGIDHLDIVIANAGITGPPGFASIDVVTAEALTECFKVNTLGPIFLFQATKSLLEKSKDPKWVVVSTYISSIGLLGTNGMHVAPAYGISKAGLNWATVSVHATHKWLTAISLHPGLVQTDMGNAAAKSFGMAEAPTSKQASADAIIAVRQDRRFDA
ncbi:hypothetical protein BKA64DRAFT_648348 [Cadophora sp. MPI-SDFR-AT-0126]|nr:hypothetical protein BKA64DRAFT_648348 [Leotiomycetes sp. MPI-SDFR-AT-0126]